MEPMLFKWYGRLLHKVEAMKAKLHSPYDLANTGGITNKLFL